VSSLVAFYPNEIWLPIVGYPFALAVGLGMIEGDYHWLSDVVAGGLMGYAIGWVIGRNFRQRFDLRNTRESVRAQAHLELIPTPTGLRVAYSY
jgi:membrane-associated phospholipid phosphatase